MSSSISNSGMLKKHKKSCSAGLLQCCSSVASPEDLQFMVSDFKMARSKLSIKQIKKKTLPCNQMTNRLFVPTERTYTQNRQFKVPALKINFLYQNRQPAQQQQHSNSSVQANLQSYKEDFIKKQFLEEQRTEAYQINDATQFAIKSKLLGIQSQLQNKQKILVQNVPIAEQKQEEKISKSNLDQINFQMSMLLQSSKGSRSSRNYVKMQKYSHTSIRGMMNTGKKEELFGTSNSNADLANQISITKSLQIPSVNAKPPRKTFQRGNLFSMVKRIDTKFSGDHESNSSHYSQVIEDYQSLLSKIKENRLEDSQINSFIQI